jgi:hypothetical protein
LKTKIFFYLLNTLIAYYNASDVVNAVLAVLVPGKGGAVGGLLAAGRVHAGILSDPDETSDRRS